MGHTNPIAERDIIEERRTRLSCDAVAVPAKRDQQTISDIRVKQVMIRSGLQRFMERYSKFFEVEA